MSVSVLQGGMVCLVLCFRMIWCVCLCVAGWYGVSVVVFQDDMVCLSLCFSMIWCVCLCVSG